MRHITRIRLAAGVAAVAIGVLAGCSTGTAGTPAAAPQTEVTTPTTTSTTPSTRTTPPTRTSTTPPSTTDTTTTDTSTTDTTTTDDTPVTFSRDVLPAASGRFTAAWPRLTRTPLPAIPDTVSVEEPIQYNGSVEYFTLETTDEPLVTSKTDLYSSFYSTADNETACIDQTDECTVSEDYWIILSNVVAGTDPAAALTQVASDTCSNPIGTVQNVPAIDCGDDTRGDLFLYANGVVYEVYGSGPEAKDFVASFTLT